MNEIKNIFDNFLPFLKKTKNHTICSDFNEQKTLHLVYMSGYSKQLGEPYYIYLTMQVKLFNVCIYLCNAIYIVAYV